MGQSQSDLQEEKIFQQEKEQWLKPIESRGAMSSVQDLLNLA